MWRETHAVETRVEPLSFGWLDRSSRSVRVRVFEGGREVDGFQSSRPETLRAALRAVYRHLSRKRGAVQFIGVEERWMLPGIRRERREVELANFGAALLFLIG
ncbi:MAG: hypothetical protein ACYC66_07545 [Chloroflexota bacterium]